MSESEFHYVRVAGDEGGVDAVDGRAIGVDLEAILKDGLPPFKVALEIIAALCEILDISDQDGETNGDVNPHSVFVDDTGAVSIEGFGLEPEQIRAPEGELLGPVTDLYGLGYTAFRLLSTRDLVDLPNDPDAHDDAVIDAVIALPWGDMPEEWVGDIQWFLAKLMSFDPDQRPTAVEAWRTFIAFASDADGTSLIDWAPDAIEGGGERRDAAMAVRPAITEEEDLGGPVVKSVGLQKGAISFGGGAAKGGQATAFWSKEQMKAALEAEDEDDGDAPEEAPAFKPQAAAATSFWTRDQMEAMARGEGDAPRPKRKEGAAPRQPAAAPAAPPPPVAHKPIGPPPVSPPPVAPPPVGQPSVVGGPVAGGPVAGGPVAAQPGMGGPIGGPVASDAADDDEESGGGGKMGLIIGVGVVVLILLCGGVLAIGGVGYLVSSGTTTATTSPATPSPSAADQARDREEPAEKFDTAVEEVTPTEALPEPEPEPAPAPAPSPPPATRAPAPAPAPAPTPPATRSRGGTTTSSPAPATRSRGGTTTAAKPTAGPTRVIFTVPGEGTVRCGDGSSASITDKGSLTVNLTAGGETCSFVSGGKPVCAGFVEPGNRKCSCDAGSGLLSCD